MRRILRSFVIAAAIAGAGLVPAGANADAPRAMLSQVHLVVAGDVDAWLIDAKGRRSGWIDGRRVAELPGCSYSGSNGGEAKGPDIPPRDSTIDIESIPPDIHEFTLYRQTATSYRLLVAPRTTGDVQITLQGLMQPRGCGAQRHEDVVAGRMREWRVRWNAAMDTCSADIVEIRTKKTGSPR